MANTPYPQSYYAASANPAPERPALQGEVETDVCVIGAGYTGLSSALFLLENGFKVTVLEAAKVGFGASGRNGGQIVNSYSRDIDVIERSVGAKQAQLLGQMAFEGGKIIRDCVATYQIQCDLKDGGVFAAITSKQMGHLEAQKKLWERYGNNQLELLDQRRIRPVVSAGEPLPQRCAHPAGQQRRRGRHGLPVLSAHSGREPRLALLLTHRGHRVLRVPHPPGREDRHLRKRCAL